MKPPFRAAPALLLSLLSFVSSPALAAEEVLPTPTAMGLSGSRSLAMGDAFRAVASSNEAIFFNLAGLVQAEKYEVGTGYALNRADDLSAFGVSVTDSRTARIAAALAYTRLTGDGAQGPVSGHVGHLGVAFPFSDVGAIGLGAKYLNFSTPARTNAVTSDLGLMIRAGDWVRLGAAAYNIVDVKSEQAPLSAGGGIAIGEETSFRGAFDAVFDLSLEDRIPVSLHAGGEYLVAGQFPVRLGFKRFDDADRNFLSLGGGYMTQEFGLEGAYVQNLRKDESRDRTFSLNLKLFL